MTTKRNNLIKGNGPYRIILDQNFCDSAPLELYARRQYRTLKLATEALPGVRLQKRGSDYAVIFGGRMIGVLSKAPAPTIERSTPKRSELRQTWQAITMTIAAVIGRFV